MEYISVKEAAEKWNMSVRYVQRRCTEGRIQGAVKFGGAWMIPVDAGKPADLRKADAVEHHRNVSPKRTIPMPLINTPFAPGKGRSSVDTIADPEMRDIALSEYYYFSGQSEKASEIAESYLTHEDIALRVSACWIYGYANLALNRIPQTREAFWVIQNTVETLDDSTPIQIRSVAACILTAARILLHLPLPEEVPDIKPMLPLLPPGLRLFSLYVQSHRAYLNGDYGVSIGIAETALVMEEAIYPIPTIYLHLVATMSYMSLRQPEAARKHLISAWELALSDDLIEAFGEHHGLLGGMLEAVIKKDWPEDFKRVIDITYRFSAGWRKIHNPDTGHDVADDLTTTEFAIAMLASRGWSNQPIAEHLGISQSTVKKHIATAMRKLNVSQRDELVQFMLQ